MLTKLEALIGKLTHRDGVQRTFRKRALNRMHARLHDAEKAGQTAKHLEDKDAQLRIEAFELSGSSDKLAAAGRKQRRAKRVGDRAKRFRAKANKERARADEHKAAIRVYTQRLHKIDTSLEAAKAELAKLGPRVNFQKQKTTGGAFPQRWIASNVASWQRWTEGIRAGRYSQEGVANIHIPYGPGPRSGRDDCSSYGRSQCLATGADDPSGHGFSPEGFTGDMAEAHGRWQECSKAEMMAAGAGFIIYGSGPGHHTEMYCPTKSEPERTIGHGSEPVDPGTIHLFGTSEFERYFRFNPRKGRTK